MNRLKPKQVLGVLIVCLLGSSAILGTHVALSRSQSNQSQQQDSTMSFRFENYNSAEETKAALTALFPIGTPLDKLNSFMKELKAECDGTSEWTFCYYYTDPKSPAPKEWSVMAEADNGQITALHVGYFDHSPGKARQVKGYKGFRFEDYETAEAAQEKLTAILPLGTAVDTLAEFMKNLGARCDEAGPSDPENGFIRCDYHVQTSLISGIHWYLVADFDKARKITSLEVYRHISGI